MATPSDALLLKLNTAELCGRGEPDTLFGIFESIQASQWSPRDWLARPGNSAAVNDDVSIIPFDRSLLTELGRLGIRLDEREKILLHRDLACWSLSQSLHGEQGALHAASLASLEANSLSLKLACAAQVIDEARHIAVFQQYLFQTFGEAFPITASFRGVIDAINMEAASYYRYAGMQLVVEGLALSAFGNLMRTTSDQDLSRVLHKILEDEAHHVRIGVVHLGEVIPTLSEAERDRLDDWILEISKLMFDRFNAEEVRQKWFGERLSEESWRALVNRSDWLGSLQAVMRTRLRRLFERAGFTSRHFFEGYERMVGGSAAKV